MTIISVLLILLLLLPILIVVKSKNNHNMRIDVTRKKLLLFGLIVLLMIGIMPIALFDTSFIFVTPGLLIIVFLAILYPTVKRNTCGPRYNHEISIKDKSVQSKNHTTPEQLKTMYNSGLITKQEYLNRKNEKEL